MPASRSLSIVIGLALALPAPALGQATARRSVQLSAAQALALAKRSAARGDAGGAAQIYRTLTRDAAAAVRAEAHYRLAELLADQGKLSAAAVELRRLIDEQPGAAAVRIGLAQLLDRMGDIDGARRQLRAAQASGLSPSLARFGDRYAASLRARAPFGWSVEMTLAPDSNINRATRSDTLGTVIGDFAVDPGAKATSGVGAAIAGSAFVRRRVTADLAWVTRVNANADRYRQSDFDRLNLSLASGVEWSLGRTLVAADAGLGKSTFGGKPFQRFAQASLRAYRPLGARAAATLSLSGALIDNQRNDLQDGRSLGGEVAIDRALSPSAGVQLSLSGNRFKARDAGYSTSSWEAGVGGWVDLGQLTVSATIAHGGLKADRRLALFPATRADRTDRATLGFTARQLQWFGFAPLARLTVERNRSNIAIWDYHRRRLELGVTRAF